LNDSVGPSKWYDKDIKNNDALRDIFNQEATTDPQYLFNPYAVNFYVNKDSYSSVRGPTIVTGYAIFRDIDVNDHDPWHGSGNWVHEIGHYFGLSHIFPANDCPENNPGTPGDGDGIWETLPEVSCWDHPDSIALYNFGLPFNQLSPTDSTLVDNTFFNMMSYHQLCMMCFLAGVPCGHGTANVPSAFNARMQVLTEIQADIWADACNGTRWSSVTGTTWFVGGPYAADNNPGIYHLLPKEHVWAGLISVDPTGGDIILLRPGHYNEQLVIDTPMTLRATRAGSAWIGAP
jgi:hypothetical protein